MYAARLVNIKSNFDYGINSKFNTPEEAQSWVDSVIGSEAALMPERIVSITDEYDQDDVLQVIQSEVVVSYNEVPVLDEQGNPVLDENGNPMVDQVPVTEMQDTHVKLKAQFTSEIVDITAEYDLAQRKAEAQAYLNSTDWYVIRNHERGIAVPEAITQARLDAIATLNL